MRKRESILSQFESRVQKGVEVDCWLWLGKFDRFGYAQVGRYSASRFAYALVNGQINQGLEIHHICLNRACVNPAHLEVLSVKEHRLKHLPISQSPAAIASRKTHCPQGHPYDLINTKFYHGGRYCRICMRAIRKEQRRRKRLAGKSDRLARP